MSRYSVLTFAGLALLPCPLPAQEKAEGEKPDTQDLWATEAELGITSATGNTDAVTGTGRVASDRTGERFALHLMAEGRYASEDGQTTAQRAHGSTQVDYSFRPHVYTYGVVDAVHDRFAGFDVRLRESVGVGRRFFTDRPNLDWRLEGGPGLRQEWRRDGTYDNSVDARARTLLVWRFQEEAAFTQEVTWTHSMEDRDNFLVASETAVRFQINANLSFKTSVRVEHDSEPEPGFERTDIFTTTSLLYHF